MRSRWSTAVNSVDTAPPTCWVGESGVRSDGVLVLERLQPLHRLVELGVGQRRGVEHVVAPARLLHLLGEGGVLLAGVRRDGGLGGRAGDRGGVGDVSHACILPGGTDSCGGTGRAPALRRPSRYRGWNETVSFHRSRGRPRDHDRTAPSPHPSLAAPGSTGAREEEILDACVSELLENGYDRLTMDAVAKRARASKATLYRRWQSKQSLVVDAVIRSKRMDEQDVPDTGSLRGDLLALWSRGAKGRRRAAAGVLGVVITALQTDAEFAADFRARFLAPKMATTSRSTAAPPSAASCAPAPTRRCSAPRSPASCCTARSCSASPSPPTAVERVLDQIVLPAATGRSPRHRPRTHVTDHPRRPRDHHRAPLRPAGPRDRADQPRATSHGGLALALICIAQLMVVLDATITNIALPYIQADLDFSANALPWIITAYALAFGGFLLLGGRCGDLFGRRRAFVFGLRALRGGLPGRRVRRERGDAARLPRRRRASAPPSPPPTRSR